MLLEITLFLATFSCAVNKPFSKVHGWLSIITFVGIWELSSFSHFAKFCKSSKSFKSEISLSLGTIIAINSLFDTWIQIWETEEQRLYCASKEPGNITVLL